MQDNLSLKSSLQYLKGVGPQKAAVLSKLDLFTIEDLFYFFPRRYEDRTAVVGVSKLEKGLPEEKICVRGRVESRGFIRRRGGPALFRVVLRDGGAALFGTWFNQAYLTKVFMPKMEVIFYGKPEPEGKNFRMMHPEYEVIAEEGQWERVHSGRIAPIYALTEDLGQKGVRQFLFRQLRDHARLFPEILPAAVRSRRGLSDRIFSFKNIHFPEGFAELRRAYRRLVFDEFLMIQLAIGLRRIRQRAASPGLSHTGGAEQVKDLIGSLPFELTAGQRSAIDDILKDMRSDRPMNRLVQGDVGSGKTAVAACALLATAANGFQGAIMAPTEVLAQQHFLGLASLLEPLGVRCGYLAQGMAPEERRATLEGLASGQVQVIIGTHALIQNEVRFSKLGLAVIDEQHKFGVVQRAALKEKGGAPHFLIMTATPIPRTLAMTLYGDMDISVMNELPKERKPVRTLWVGESRRSEIYAFLEKELSEGRQAYVLCPRVNESAAASPVSAKSVLAAHRELTRIFSHRKVGILHGKMRSAEKQAIMRDFKSGATELLVSTVVIEVGVDVPNANLMIIENAERFGLSQLHQLRGRVGRGSREATCVLFSEGDSEETSERLSAFEKTQSGFDIAETDLKLRGAGEIVGSRQHGLPELRIGDLSKDGEIMRMAREEAVAILEKDPKLCGSEHRALRAALEARFKIARGKPAVLA